MPIYFYNGAILFESDQIAMAEACCCDPCDAVCGDLELYYAVDVPVCDYSSCDPPCNDPPAGPISVYGTGCVWTGFVSCGATPITADLTLNDATCEWELRVWCMGEAEITIWQGTKAVGTSPVGSYTRTGGTCSQATVSVG